jgi:hypothetical protein
MTERKHLLYGGGTRTSRRDSERGFSRRGHPGLCYGIFNAASCTETFPCGDAFKFPAAFSCDCPGAGGRPVYIWLALWYGNNEADVGQSYGGCIDVFCIIEH